MSRAAIVLTLLVLPGCSTLYGPAIVGAGETFCTSPLPEVCRQLGEVAATLHTPEMEARIHAAKPGVPREYEDLVPERNP